jgi:hypothetical protein
MTLEEFAKFTPTTIFEAVAVEMFKFRGPNFVPAVKEITDRIEGKAQPRNAEIKEDNGPTQIVVVPSWKQDKPDSPSE